jgi:hypothetical protein
MARRKITEDLYNRLLDEFRKDPDHPYSVAPKAGVDPRTAIKAWELGWPKKGMEPVKTVMQREQIKARALLMGEHAAKKAIVLKEREDAIKQAAESRAQEGQMVNLARGSSAQALTVAVNLAMAARKLADQVKAKVIELANLDPKEPTSLTPTQGLVMLTRIADLQQKINSTALSAMQMERLHLGQPMNIMAGVITSQTEMTIEEASARIEMANQALEGARRVGGLTVIDGGMNHPLIGKEVVTAPELDSGIVTKANIQ